MKNNGRAGPREQQAISCCLLTLLTKLASSAHGFVEAVLGDGVIWINAKRLIEMRDAEVDFAQV